MKKLTAGIIAHVDAGKTTLAEALLYGGGILRSQGRVDKKDALLDDTEIERERGITVFSSSATFTAGETRITLLDTPGHVDFSPEAERVFTVLDAAILVVSASEGIQAHTRTMWSLTGSYGLPVFIFVTKCDLGRRTKNEIMAELCSEFGSCVDMERADGIYTNAEKIAESNEELLEEFVSTGALCDRSIAEAVLRRELFPVFFGSGLKNEGVSEFASALDRFTLPKTYGEEFGAQVFKITREKGERLTHLKVTGGALKVKDPVKYGDGEEKINQIRLYNGPKFVSVNEALPGDVCAVTGLSKTFAGEKLGSSAGVKSGHLEPVMRYRMIIPESVPARTFYPIVKALEEENPELRVRWDERASAIFVSLMGTVQAEILKRLIKDRSDVDVGFDTGTVIYKETIAGRVEGVGHYEPLKHYAEVHLVLEELPRGSGLVLASSCRENDLELRWQRLILTHLAEKEHLGVLTGSAITDMKITLTAGKAHLKHTEGGDFRQATYRAVRQGLMKAESVLLEPYYSFVMELPASDVGRAITDVRMMGGEFEPPSEEGGVSVLRGRAPVKEMDGYMTTLASYTGGEGKLSLSFAGYDRCHDADKVIKTIDYDPERDVANSPDSVFCAHGAGFVVKWNEVGEYMHLEATLAADKGAAAKRRNISIDEKELEAIMLREFGPIKRPVYSEPRRVEAPAKRHKVGGIDTSLIIIDGYNVIYSWDDLRAIADAGDLEGARERLISIAVNYAAFTGCRTAVVFDAYRVPGGNGEKYEKNGVNIVYTKENETGDAYIERIVYGIGKNEKVRVVTSDWLIQLTALRTGVLRMSSAEFEAEVEAVDARIGELIKKHFDVYDSDGGA